MHHEAASYLKNSKYENYLKLFLHREIHKKLGISFDDFLNRPYYEIEAMFSALDEYDRKRHKAMEKATAKVDEAIESKHVKDSLSDLLDD